MILIITELIIYIYTSKYKEKTAQDQGTKWLLYFNFLFCIVVSFYGVSQPVVTKLQISLLPSVFTLIGIISIIVGILIRIKAVVTLKKAFTLSVQTIDQQQLITTGIYHLIRHPAYTGSIVSLLGVALSLRSIIATILVLISCLVCYHIRIATEEKALLIHFGKEYLIYQKSTYKLFPFIL